MCNSPTVCLTMIVKNESNIITRLFDSLVYMDTSSYFIDTYCICDTGSTDDTIKIIKEYFQKRNIPGKITYEPFKNFNLYTFFLGKFCYFQKNGLPRGKEITVGKW